MKRFFIFLVLILTFSMSCFFISCSNETIEKDSQKTEQKSDEKKEDKKDADQDAKDTPEEQKNELLKDVVFNDGLVVYDGNYHLLSVENVPDYATVLYTPAYGAKKAGVHEIKAKITFCGETKELTATLTIEKAVLNVTAQEKIIYEGVTPIFDYAITGFMGNDNVSCLTKKPVAYNYQQKSVGIYNNEIIFSSAEAENYSFNYIPANLIVKAKDEPIIQSGYVLFGNYPQTIISNKTLVDEIMNKINDGTLIQDSSTGFYNYNGQSYAKVVASPHTSTMCLNKFSNDEVIEKNKTYFFLVEPIKWKILKQESKIYLTTDILLDIQQFDDSRDKYYVDSEEYLCNDYAVSYIRSFLNNLFIDTAFGGVTDNLNDITSLYIHEAVDKVCLLSKDDVEGKDPNSFDFNDNNSRKAKVSDYSLAKGAFTDSEGYGYWWLGNPDGVGYVSYYKVAVVKADGDVSYDYWDVVSDSCSVRPLICIDFE